MSEAVKFTPSPSFDAAAQALDLPGSSFWFNQYPAEQAARLAIRVKQAARLLAKCTGLQHSKALDAVAQALRFPAWHHLAAHLTRAETFEQGRLPAGWLDALSGAIVLGIAPEDEVSLPTAQLDALEHLARSLAMLTDSGQQPLLDAVCAPLCGGVDWQAVRQRSPLQAVQPLYRFEVAPEDADAGVSGWFDESPACMQLVEELDDTWQGYDDFSKPQKRKARAWVEAALRAQPGFLEAGLALACIERDAGEVAALATAKQTLRLAESLIPKGFKGCIEWSHLGNRCYHRLLWLQMELLHEQGNPAGAAKLARRQLRLNPRDNLGVRSVLPLLLLQAGDTVAARRSLKGLDEEHELTAAVVRAFVAHAESDVPGFRLNLAMGLFTLPSLRAFLLNDDRALAPGEQGFRGVQVDLEDFRTFAWPVYCTQPGLRRASQRFLAETDVQQAEQELAAYWGRLQTRDRSLEDPNRASLDGWRRRLCELAEQVSRGRNGPADAAA
jgi:hypothetical protein